MSGRKMVLVLLVSLILLQVSFAQSTDEQKVQDTLKKAASRLGWPQNPKLDNESTLFTTYGISQTGDPDTSDLKGSIMILHNDVEAPYWMFFLDTQLMFTMGTYQGRAAEFIKTHEECHPEGLIKVISDAIYGFFDDLFGTETPEDERCVDMHGTIIFSCGKYMFVAGDETDQGGAENDIAAALYAAASENGLCGYGDTLIIPAGTVDKPGATKISEYIKKAQTVNEYYAVNSYNKQTFTYTFKDADGSAGDNDWYSVGATQAGMSDKAYFEAAVKKAFEGTDIKSDLRFKRIAVLFSGKPDQEDPSAVFSTQDSWHMDDYFVEVTGGDGNKYKVYTTDRIMIAETDSVGDWSHEFGHSLWWKYLTDGKWNKINDRYNYAGKPTMQYGAVDYWDLMGDGNYLGNPKGTSPAQMSGYTKEAAGWLKYATLEGNKSYTETAIENKHASNTVLQFDDPASADPQFFYVVEARDSSQNYSAPESGVVLYKVAYDATNKHEIVNNIRPQIGTTRGIKDGSSYSRSTLHSGAATYINVPDKFKLTLEGETASPYTATIKLTDFMPRNMVGAIARPRPIAAGAAAGTPKNSEGPMPDIDLHAYDANGGHVGLDYGTGEYENTIAGAYGSGDLKDDSEWIFVPEGTQVRFEVSGYKAQQFAQENPGYASLVLVQEFNTTLIKIDANGNELEADGGSGSVSAGQKTDIKSVDDASLSYRARNYPGFGNNGICGLFPAMILVMAVICVFRR